MLTRKALKLPEGVLTDSHGDESPPERVLRRRKGRVRRFPAIFPSSGTLVPRWWEWVRESGMLNKIEVLGPVNWLLLNIVKWLAKKRLSLIRSIYLLFCLFFFRSFFHFPSINPGLCSNELKPSSSPLFSSWTHPAWTSDMLTQEIAWKATFGIF